jgi:hypothetical protein
MNVAALLVPVTLALGAVVAVIEVAYASGYARASAKSLD